MYYVYLLKDLNRNLHYIGYTNDLERRIFEHLSGKSKYTQAGEWKLIYYEAYLSESDARKRERMLKQNGNSRRYLLKRVENSDKV